MDACPTRFDLQGPAPDARHQVIICSDAETLAQRVVEDFLSAAREAIAAYGDAHVVLAGGSTPRRTYQKLAQVAQNFPWERVHLYWTDERAVPPDHVRSNYRMVKEALLDAVPLPPANVHRIPTEHPPQEAARAYDALLARLPRPFDWVLLGVGTDGHTASLFPGTSALRETKRRAVAVYVPSLGEWRITLTYPVLNQALRVRFLVSGEEKASMLRTLLFGPYDPERFPAQNVRPSTPVVWFLDEDAAREIPRSRR